MRKEIKRLEEQVICEDTKIRNKLTIFFSNGDREEVIYDDNGNIYEELVFGGDALSDSDEVDMDEVFDIEEEALRDEEFFNQSVKQAEGGNIGAQLEVALCYYLGEGVEQSNLKAIEWFKKAADNGNVEALFNLGVIYLEEGDFENAEYWLSEAKEQGDEDADDELERLKRLQQEKDKN